MSVQRDKLTFGSIERSLRDVKAILINLLIIVSDHTR